MHNHHKKNRCYCRLQIFHYTPGLANIVNRSVISPLKYGFRADVLLMIIQHFIKTAAILSIPVLFNNISYGYRSHFIPVKFALSSLHVFANERINKSRLGSLATFFTTAIILCTTVTPNWCFHSQAIASTIDETTTSEQKIKLDDILPTITDICWLDLNNQQTPENNPHSTDRIELSLFGNVMPQTVANFKQLATGDNNAKVSYRGSNIFRIISTFSIQGGNIGALTDANPPRMGRFGKSAINEGKGFEVENYRILHQYPSAGVVSMMKDIQHQRLQDSRFFITLSPDASWADDRYAAFGLVTKGMDVVQRIAQMDVVPPSNIPVHPIVIEGSGCYPPPPSTPSNEIE